ncbi:protein TALPID3 isoform X3 [Ascaphus truei]|uniref:protein TALPID3 isoform X3 n=1 Tax=Ascaphus truei TaxID=8439 RepID=UPI003F59BBD0
MEEEASDTSLGSAASTTASDVLIRSTGIHRTRGYRTGARAGGAARRSGQEEAGHSRGSAGRGGQEEAGYPLGSAGRGGQEEAGHPRGSVSKEEAGYSRGSEGRVGQEEAGYSRGSEGRVGQEEAGYPRGSVSRGGQEETGNTGGSVGKGRQVDIDYSRVSLGRDKQVVTGFLGRSVVRGGQRESDHLGTSLGSAEQGETEHPRGSMRRSGQVETVSFGGSPDSSLYSGGSRVQISLKRLREVPSPFPDFAFSNQDTAYIPPALPANKYPAVKFTSMEGIADAMKVTERQKKSSSKKESSSPKVYVTKHLHNVTGEKATMKKSQMGRKHECKDTRISQFVTGQKEALLAVLNKRVQGAPVSKQVRVQLLEDVGAERRETLSHRQFDSATTVAAATAAAIAAAAPLLKAQSDIEAQVSSVSQLLNKLHEADQQRQRLTEQQSKIQSQPPERSYPHDRVSELERQLTQLTEQRLKHLEQLQTQQMEMQSHFISSAIKAGNFQHGTEASACTHAPTAVSEHLPLNYPIKMEAPNPAVILPNAAVPRCTGKSPLETPAPRRFAPVPMAKDAQDPPKPPSGKENVGRSKNPVNLGKGNFLQQILGRGGSPFCPLAYDGHAPVKLAQTYKHPHTDSSDRLPAETGIASESLPGSTNPASYSAVQKANDVLHDLGQLKKEMHGMLQVAQSSCAEAGISLKPDLLVALEDCSCPPLIQVMPRNQTCSIDAKQWRPQGNEFKPSEQPSSSHVVHVLQKPQPSFLRGVKPPKSMFEDAERILREVQNNKKVLEDNLEAIIRAKDGAAVYSLINALATNSNTGEKLRVRKAVDAWITEIGCEIQDEMAKKDFDKRNSDRRAQESALRKQAESTKEMKSNKERNFKALGKTASTSKKPSATVSAKTPHQQTGAAFAMPSFRKGAVSQAVLTKDGRSKVSRKPSDFALLDEDVLTQVYGKPVYDGHRSTLKKGPYLRINSPSPKSKPRRPKVLETVRGVKLKSAKTQTGSSPCKAIVTKPRTPERSAPADHETQYVFSPSREAPSSSAPLEGHLIPMAIPLGRWRCDGVPPVPSAVVLARPQPVTVNVSIPPSSPKPHTRSVKPNIAVIEMRSEKKDPPQLTVQVLPCVDIDSIASDSTDLSQRSPSPEIAPPLPPPAEPNIQPPVIVESEEEEEEVPFPGSSFIQVTDIIQDQEDADEIPEPLLELNGWTESVPTQYNGIPFPPPAPAPQTATDILDGIINRRETLENRLINWVEQEIMARIISEMYPLRQQTVPDVSLSSSDESVTVASDIVETAGGEGLQLFVDAGVPVDSNLIRKFVDEALAETISIMLGERETRNASPPPARKPAFQVPAEISPVPTPQCTPPASPLTSVPEPPLVRTPDTSPHTSIAEAEQDHSKDGGITPPPSLVVTPVITPIASPPRVATPTPLQSEVSRDQRDTQTPGPPSPWGDMELPLEEENPHSLKEVAAYKDAVVMTVAKDEEPESLISVTSPEPDKSSESLPAQAKTPSPVPSPSSAASTEETISNTETDTTDRPISEGEVLYSYGQMIAARAFAEGGLAYPNLTESLSSTLRDAHEMSSKEENSMGEISEGQRPRLTRAAEQVLLGHSASMGRPANAGQAAGHQSRFRSSPGHCNGTPGAGLGSGYISQGLMSIGELESHPWAAHYPQRPVVAKSTSQGPEMPNEERQPAPAHFIKVTAGSEDDADQGPWGDLDRTRVEPNVYLRSMISEKAAEPPKRMSVTLPSMTEVNDAEDRKTTFGESDSSGADTF